MAREYFCAYHSYLKAIETLTDVERGRLFAALLEYSMTGVAPELRGSERHVFPLMREQIDRDIKNYESKGIKRSEAGKTAANARWGNADACVECDSHKSHAVNAEDKDEDEDKDEIKKTADAVQKKAAASRHQYGQYGWVKLSEAEYARLADDYGEKTVSAYIAVVDESAQQTGNKNGWKDWNLTVRKAIRDKWGGGGARAAPVDGRLKAEQDHGKKGVCPY